MRIQIFGYNFPERIHQPVVGQHKSRVNIPKPFTYMLSQQENALSGFQKSVISFVAKKVGQGCERFKTWSYLFLALTASRLPALSVAKSIFDLSDLNGINGFIVRNQPGWSIGSGDINGDGIDDLLIGAPEVLGSRGRCYVVFGSKNNPFPLNVDFTLLDGTNGFIVNGIEQNDSLGRSIHSGDINGDGIDDLLIGASGANLTGQAYVVFGSRRPFSPALNLSNLDGTQGFVIKGTKPYDWLGNSISSGDLNDDGIDDVVIGANPLSFKGQNYVVFGSRTLFPRIFDLANLDGSNGFIINGGTIGYQSRWMKTGDINNDGITAL